MRGRLRIPYQHGIAFHPGLVGDGREVAPQRAVGNQLVALQLRGEHALERRQHRRLILRIEAEVLPRGFVGLDDPGAPALLVLVAVREDDALGRFAEEILEGIERPGGTEPGEFVRPQVDAGLEVRLVLFSYRGINAVGDNDQIRFRHFFKAFYFPLKIQLHTQFAAAVVQDVQQRHPRAAAETVAARAHGAALEDHVHVAPVGEAAPDHLVGGPVVGLEGVQRLVGEHDAEAEGVVRTVALVERDVPARPRFLRQQREVQAAGAAADDGDLHAGSGITAVVSISTLASSSTNATTCTTAIAG